LDNGLESIYRAHRSGLFALALAITRSRPEAEDAVHDAFARLCRNGALRDGDGVAYVFKAVRNAAIDRVRRRSGDADIPLALQACLEAKAHGVSTGERDHAIATAIESLPAELRAVVLLRNFCGLTFKQVSEIEDAPLQTVASRYKAALDRLRPKLKDWL
jgi:RNA polymerase sigma-70 factor (ECF subfamily)